MIEFKSLPTDPGVYLFKDKERNIIYIGKARNLRSRVSSYFTGKDHSAKTQVLVKNIASVDFIVVDTEVEALLLENKLIKQHTPKYNISLKDAKTFAYIMLTDEKFPRILSTRKVGKTGEYFGPYTDGGARAELVQLAIKLFKLRVCKTLPKRPCLNYHIGLCTAPCINNVNEEQYQEQVNQARRLLKGDTKEILQRLEQKMKDASAAQKFELALQRKREYEAVLQLHERQKVDVQKQFDQDVVVLQEGGEKSFIELFSIKKGVISGKKEFSFERQEGVFESFIKLFYSQNPVPREVIVNVAFWGDDAEKTAFEEYLANLRHGAVSIVLPERGEKLGLVRLAEKNAMVQKENTVLQQLQEKLILPELPGTIECFDISNLGYDHVVAGMTQWVDGKPNKHGYRKFKIKTVEGKNDDFASMREVVYRRYARLVKENVLLPNLIIIDGGKGQLAAALAALNELALQIPIIALAKKEEEIYIPHEDEPLRFPKSSPMMLFIRRIRDSVHDFALAYNRKRRQMRMREDFKENKEIA